MALINASDATALANRAFSPERLMSKFEIAEKIVHYANKGEYEVTIDFGGDKRLENFSVRDGLVEYLMARGYDIVSRDAKTMKISWYPYDPEDDDATK